MIVEKETDLSQTLQDGSTKLSHLIKIAKQTGKIPDELITPDTPAAGRYIKHVFDSLSTTRRWTQQGPERITLADIHYWCLLNNTTLSPMQTEAIARLDITQINSFNRET